jgi:hypothetical protein
VNLDELIAKLRKSGVTTSASTIRRWARSGIITAPTLRHRQKGEGRGTISDWPQQSLEEIAGYWAVLHYGVKEFGILNRDYEDSVSFAKQLADYFYADPIGWELQYKQALYNKFYVRDEFDQLSKALGRRLHETDFRNLTAWVAAVEKIRRGRKLADPVRCNFVFLREGEVKNKTLGYRFFGVGLIEIKGPRQQDEIRVSIYERQAFIKAAKKQVEEIAQKPDD